MILVPVLIVAVLSYLIYYMLTKDFDYWKKRNVRGPKPRLFFGNLIDTTLRRVPMPLAIKKLYDEFPDEKVIGVFRMKTPNLIVRDPEIIKHITIKDFDNFTDRGVEFTKKGLGSNLFHADGETWRILRNKFTPIFTSGKLKNMLYLIVNRGDMLMDHIQELVQQNPDVEIKSIIQKYTITSISATAFGLDMEYDDKKLFNQLDEIDRKIFSTNISNEMEMMFPGILKKIGGSVFPPSLTSFFQNMVKNVVSQRNGKPTARNDFIDLMLAMKQAGIVTRKTEDSEKSLEMTDTVMAAQAFVFYAAGYETSATTMTFMMYQLALNPDVQDRLIAHVDEVLARHGGQTTYECLMELTYMDQVMSETLRMYPIVDPLQRKAVNDYKLPGTDIVVEKGQIVLFSVCGLHYDEKYFKNPHQFNPDNFSPENVRDRPTCAYMPFGQGPRNCIGMRFAQVQSRVLLAKFFSKYRVQVTRDTKIPLEFDGHKLLLSAKGGIPLRIVPRK